MTSPLIDADTSRRITALRALLMLAVVGIHSQKGVLYIAGGETPAATLVFTTICRHLFQTAVPLYFAISGYLLFLRYDGNLSGYPRLAARRFRSLFLPFLLVNGFWLAWLTVVGGIPGIGGTTFLKTRGYLELLLGLNGWPLIYPLWFLRDLFALFLLAPVFGFLLARAPYLGLAGLWIMSNFVMQGYVPVEYSGAFYFYLGGLAAVKRWRLTCTGGTLAALWLAFAALAAVSVTIHAAYPDNPWKFPVWRMCVLAGTAAVWCWSGKARLQDWTWLARIAPMIFFVYLAHEPVLSYLADFLRGKVVLADTAAQLGGAAGLTAVTTLACLALAAMFRRLLPPVYSLLTGGR